MTAAMHHVAGGDRPMPGPLEVKWAPPKPKARGLDWSKHRAPEPERPAVVRPDATVTEIRKRVIAPTLKKKCACGADISGRATHCRNCAGRTAAANRGTYKTRTSIVDVPTAREEYLAGSSCPEIAKRHGWPIISVRRQLAKAGVPMRDDRSSRSGGQTRTYDPALVARVRALYLDQGLSQSKVARELGIGPKVVVVLMQREGIPARQGASGGGDTLQGYRDRLDQLGVTASDVRTWANTNGHPCGIRGVVAEHVIDAYEAAHHTTTPTKEGTS